MVDGEALKLLMLAAGGFAAFTVTLTDWGDPRPPGPVQVSV
jgi:hypothetical protein